tara:strand:- start:110 stop:439 length:330 start_codon:yes stop_codon:yes gene_type:complete
MSKLLSVKEIMDIDNDFTFVSYSMNTNYIDLKDGDYKLKCKSYNYYKKSNKFVNFYSNTRVHVRSNLIETGSLLKAAGEIREQTGYHGWFLEQAEPNEDKNFIEIFFGS